MTVLQRLFPEDRALKRPELVERRNALQAGGEFQEHALMLVRQCEPPGWSFEILRRILYRYTLCHMHVCMYVCMYVH